MRIISWNLNGIRAACRNGFLDWLKQESPEILCLQEVRASKDQIPEGVFEGYHDYLFPAKKPGYAGTAILSKEMGKVKYGIGKQAFDDEGRVITVEYPGFTLINVYAPHGGRDKSKMPHKMEFYSALKNYLKNIKGNLVAAGDYNIAHTELDLARPKGNTNNTMFTPEERRILDEIEERGFVDSFRKLHPNERRYTWWPWLANARERNIGWRIDYIFTKGITVQNAEVLDGVKGSDHCPIGIELSQNP